VNDADEEMHGPDTTVEQADEDEHADDVVEKTV
jgi:hypothetical protein